MSQLPARSIPSERAEGRKLKAEGPKKCRNKTEARIKSASTLQPRGGAPPIRHLGIVLADCGVGGALGESEQLDSELECAREIPTGPP